MCLKTLTVQLDKRSYPIYIDDNWEALFNALKVKGLPHKKKLLLITDENVACWYRQPVEELFKALKYEVTTAVVKPGEDTKTLQEAENLYTVALKANLDRNSSIAALGGGVVGDLAGFTASTYMRGVPFIQIPTSLLAQVDSSIGGKVAVNHPLAKNVIGSFYQPEYVLMNISTLRTLPKRELSSGMAELIKHGIIRDCEFLGWLEENMHDLMKLNTSKLIQGVCRSCEIKADVVGQDEKEQGFRAILNFGHTIGHAIEAAAGYGTYTHGEAVAIGMMVEARIGSIVNPSAVSTDYLLRIVNILKAAGLPVRLPDLEPASLLEWMQRDKKNRDGRIGFVLPAGSGRVELFHNISNEIILKAIRELKG